MSKKIELAPEQVAECLKMYNEELLGSTTISERMGIHKTIIIRTLKENGVVLGPSGRRNTGGKVKANQRYYIKNKEKITEWYRDWARSNVTERKAYIQQWNKDNREHVNKYKRDYERKRRAEDHKYRLTARTRTAVYIYVLKKLKLINTVQHFNY